MTPDARTAPGVDAPDAAAAAAADPVPDPGGRPVGALLQDLRSRPEGLDVADAARRLLRFGPNQLHRHARRTWPRDLLHQFLQPLALLLALAAGLAFVTGSATLGWTILAVVVVNAAFALAQELHAEHAVEALRGYLPATARALRGGQEVDVPVETLVPGDVVLIEEGQRAPADVRLLQGEVDVDLSTLTGESVPQRRSADAGAAGVPLLQAPDVVFSGTGCTSGTARGLVYATGQRTELGRIVTLSQGVGPESSPLEREVASMARLLALVACGVGLAFLPLGWVAGLPLREAALFAVGLIVANVPEGLLPTITLALADAVRRLAGEGAVVKRLSAVETLGSTTVICTDKTGTLTQNVMRPVAVLAGSLAAEPPADLGAAGQALARALSVCTTVRAGTGDDLAGDPTELALLEAARVLGVPPDLPGRDAGRRHLYAFDPVRRLMTTVDAPDDDRAGGPAPDLHVKGAPEAVLARTTCVRADDGSTQTLTAERRAEVERQVQAWAQPGLRVLAVADRHLQGRAWPADRDEAEQQLRLLGLVALLDPPRPQVAAAVRRCHDAGIRIHVITGDRGDTAAEVARQVGIGAGGARVVEGGELAGLSDEQLRDVTSAGEVVFARSSPEDKLRIARALQAGGEVVAMTGDGVNDAPALRQADIGVAMGRSGTDVAREAATMVLTDDDFTTIVTAVESGRQVYANVRKFILYIFAHAVPEVLPFLLFAASGGAVPLPLTVLQILAIDLGTETLPALALGRERAEPGVMGRPPRGRGEKVVDRRLLLRAWGVLGSVSAVLVLLAFFATLLRGGWTWGAPTGVGSAGHETYLQATTATFAAIVACQVGTAVAARTERVPLRAVGLLTNRWLLAGIAFELVFTATLVYLPAANDLVGTAPLPPAIVALLLPFPVLVWGADELYRLRLRRADARR